jgi:hypothetical protein
MPDEKEGSYDFAKRFRLPGGAELIGTMDGARQTGNRSAPRRMTPGRSPFEDRFAATSD